MSCLEVLPQHRDGDVVGPEFYCTMEDVIVVTQLKNLRCLVLCDVVPDYQEFECAADYLISGEGVQEYGVDTILNWKRVQNYDIILVMESVHWVYALPLGTENDPPHTRYSNDYPSITANVVAARVNAEVTVYVYRFMYYSCLTSLILISGHATKGRVSLSCTNNTCTEMGLRAGVPSCSGSYSMDRNHSRCPWKKASIHSVHRVLWVQLCSTRTWDPRH
jgi:hypothetical protein